jgi:cysteine synthase
VVPAATSPSKVALIESQGGRCRFVQNSSQVYAEAERIARESGGHYLDQFTNAERASDWRGNNNIAESIYAQMRDEKHPIPDWIVVGAGTGGTSATNGRYIRYRRHATRLCVVDPENSAFFPAYAEDRDDIVMPTSSRIGGIGRPQVEPSFLPGVVDRMVSVPDAATYFTGGSAPRGLIPADPPRRWSNSNGHAPGADAPVVRCLAVWLVDGPVR